MSKRVRATTAVIAACLLGGVTAARLSHPDQARAADKPPANQAQVEHRATAGRRSRCIPAAIT